MRSLAAFAITLLLPACLVSAQTPPPEFTDPLALLAVVSETYASNPDTFHMESITETVKNDDLSHYWYKVYRTAIKGPNNLYRIETHSSSGSWIQVSDGINEWVYLVETKLYMVRPLPQQWPQFGGMMLAGLDELNQAWNMRIWLEAEARGYKRATMLPEETITVEGRGYSCYVAHVTSDDTSGHNDKNYHWDRTFWIDKKTHVFRKQVEHYDGYSIISKTIHIPSHQDITTVYPVANFNPQIPRETFRFEPPTGATKVASLELDFSLPPIPTPPNLVGAAAPEISFTAYDGKKIDLSSYRGKPVLIDFWATWCDACLLSMPSLSRISSEFKSQGLTVLTFDQDEVPDNATEYLSRHHYGWTNVHDTDTRISKAFKANGIPFTVLIDSQGKIVYDGSGGDETALRKAIAALETKTL